MRGLPLLRIQEVADEFLGHWDDLETQLGAPFNLPSGTTRALFQTLRDNFAAQGTSVVGDENLREMSTTQEDIYIEQLHPSAAQFNVLVRALFPNSSYSAVLGRLPSERTGRAARVEAYTNVERLWQTIDANSPAVPGFTPPLVLPNGTDLAAFSAQLSDLRAAIDSVGSTRQVERRARAVHREAADRLWAAMVEYRRMVLALHPDTAFAYSLPRISKRRKRKPKAPPAEPPA
jgi:hypothetical protein